MSAEEQIRRTRICLAEIGLEKIDIRQIGTREDGIPIIATSDPIPPAIGFQVAHLLCEREGLPCCCWSCYLDAQLGTVGAPGDCREGRCRHPEGPARPPRELLIGFGAGPVEAVDLGS